MVCKLSVNARQPLIVTQRESCAAGMEHDSAGYECPNLDPAKGNNEQKQGIFVFQMRTICIYVNAKIRLILINNRSLQGLP